MNSSERVKCVIRGETPDSLPVLPVVDGYHSPRLINRPNWECFLDIKEMTRSLLDAQDSYGYDGVLLESPIEDREKIMGCPVAIEGNEVPLFTGNLVQHQSDIDKVSPGKPMASETREYLAGVIRDVKKTRFTLGSVRLPFEVAYILRGSLNFFRDLKKDPLFARELITRCRDISLSQARSWMSLGVDGIVLKDSVASSSLISPRDYGEFAFPFEAEIVQAIREESCAAAILHICRNSLPILGMMAQTRAHVLEIDSLVPLEEVFDRVGDQVAVKGNLDAVEDLERGTGEQLDRRIAHIIEVVKKRGKTHRFILSTGDSITKMTEPVMIKKMVETGRRLGNYEK
jgi:uroporphyrinogen decarboxylase